MPTINQAGLELIEQFEGCRLVSYYDHIGQVWTIGYGHTGPDVTPAMHITMEQAKAFLERDLLAAETNVADATEVVLTPNQFSALVSFEYNTGEYAESTLCKLINQKDFDGAAAQFDRWVYGMNNGVFTTIPGLVARRAAEKALFLSDGKS